MIWAIVIGVVVLLVLILPFIVYYNKFILKGNRIDNSLAQIDVQLKKRADLVPNLIETVKGYAKHEKSIIAEVTKARKEMMSAGNINKKVQAGDKLQNALKSIFAIGENYPQLRANENFLHLQQELSAIEDKVAYARQYYNDAVLDLNNSMKMFPGNLFAKMYGVQKREFLEATAEERKVVKVKF